MARKTALYDRHIALGGKMVEFAGYMLPVQYSGITLEHRAVRQEAGIFDVSHMGEFLFTGEGAEEALNRLLTNDIRGMRDGQARYSLMANERGGAVDDVIVGRERADKFWMVVNAANRDKDAEWVKAHLTGDGVRFRDVSDDVTQVALQGPAAEKILSAVAKKEDIPAKYYTFSPDVSVGGVSEKADVLLPERLFTVGKLSVETGDASQPSDLGGYVSVERNGVAYKGYIESASYSYGKEKSVRYELIVKDVE